MNARFLYISIVLLTYVFFVSACSNKKNNQNADDISFAHLEIGIMASMDYFPLAVAQAQGLFEAEELRVTFHKFYSANERDAAFQSNSLHGAILDYTGAAIQQAGGVNLKLTSQCDGTFMLIASKKSNIESMSDIRNKKVAVSRNTVIDFCTDLLLENSQISTTDIEKVEINKIPLRLEMLRHSRIDATMLPDPFATIALQDNSIKIFDIKEFNLHVTGIAFHEDVINHEQEALAKFYKAYNRAVESINARPLLSFESILISEIGVPKELVSQIKIPKYSLAQSPQINDLMLVQKWLKKNKLVPEDYDIDFLVEDVLTY